MAVTANAGKDNDEKVVENRAGIGALGAHRNGRARLAGTTLVAGRDWTAAWFFAGVAPVCPAPQAFPTSGAEESKTRPARHRDGCAPAEGQTTPAMSFP